MGKLTATPQTAVFKSFFQARRDGRPVGSSLCNSSLPCYFVAENLVWLLEVGLFMQGASPREANVKRNKAASWRLQPAVVQNAD